MLLFLWRSVCFATDAAREAARHHHYVCVCIYTCIYIYIYTYTHICIDMHIYIYIYKPMQSAPSPLLFPFFSSRVRGHLQMLLDPREDFHWQSDGVPSSGPLSPLVPCAQVSIGKLKTRITLYVWHQSFAPVG